MSDYISKENIQHIIMQERSDFSSYSTVVDKIWRRIKTFPTADVRENIHGEWIKHSYYKGVLICSNCNHGSNMYDKDFNFCPNCGCQMNKESNNVNE